MIKYDFRTGVSARYFSSLVSVNYNLQLEEFTVPISELDLDEIGYYKVNKTNGLVRLGIFLPIYNYDRINYVDSPALHVYKCKNTEDLSYRMKVTNHQHNTFQSKELKIQIQKDLRICKECISNLRSDFRLRMGNSFNEYILALEENKRTKQTVVDEDGYIINWRQVSECFRDLSQWKCSRCGFKAKAKEERKYIHSHHRNGNKLENQKSNLECLCVECHSNVDDHHRKMFQTYNLHLLEEFKQFKNQLR